MLPPPACHQNLMLSYFIYCRKSSEDEERQVISNESQRDELNPLAKRDRLHIYEAIEEDASAKLSGTRPRFNDMVKRIKKGEANAILCWHLNRLSRNAGDAALLIELMDQDRLLEIRTPGQTFKNSPGDKFLITLFCSQAKLENDNKGVDVERGLRKKATMGFYPGVAPMGYLNDKTKLRGERDLYNDPDRFSLVKRMWQMMLTGTYTPPQILTIANKEWGFRTRRTRKQGGNPLSVSAIYHIFHNPFYYGWYEYPKGSSKWYEGKHEPMVTKAEFDHVQALLGKKGNPRSSKHLTFSFTGLIRCGECDGMITAEEKRQLICPNCRLKFVYSRKDTCPTCGTPIFRAPSGAASVLWHQQEHLELLQRVQAWGNILDFIAEMEKVSIHAAALKAIEWFKLDLAKYRAAEPGEKHEEAEAPVQSQSRRKGHAGSGESGTECTTEVPIG